MKEDAHRLPWLKPADVAKQFGLDISRPADRGRFWRQVSEWRIPHYRLGPRTIRFIQDDLDAWAAARRVPRRPTR